MYKLISIAMLAFVGFAPLSAAAPTHMGMHEVANGVPSSEARNWNSEQLQRDVVARSSNLIERAIAQALAEHRETIVKRATSNDDVAPDFNLSSLFRGLFDNVVNYIIEVTPLNDIVHGNYDLLYELFLEKVDELFSNLALPNASAVLATPATGATTKGDSPKDVSGKTDGSTNKDKHHDQNEKSKDDEAEDDEEEDNEDDDEEEEDDEDDD